MLDVGNREIREAREIELLTTWSKMDNETTGPQDDKTTDNGQLTCGPVVPLSRGPIVPLSSGQDAAWSPVSSFEFRPSFGFGHSSFGFGNGGPLVSSPVENHLDIRLLRRNFSAMKAISEIIKDALELQSNFSS